MTEVVEAEAVEEGTELEVVPPEQAGTTLFRTNDPVQVLTRAVDTANALMPMVREKKLVVKIQGRDHLTVEAWQTLGAMLGVTPVCTWTRKLEDGWEARVEARTLDGRVIGAAEAECIRAESTWKDRDDFAIRSMAQTRATSKALASVLRFVATLGGAAGTPAEEMPRDGGSRKLEGAATPAQKRAITTIFNQAGVSKDMQAKIVHGLAGDPPQKQGASEILDVLKGESDLDANQRIDSLIEKAGLGTSEVPADTSDLPPPDDGGTTLEDLAESVDQHKA